MAIMRYLLCLMFAASASSNQLECRAGLGIKSAVLATTFQVALASKGDEDFDCSCNGMTVNGVHSGTCTQCPHDGSGCYKVAKCGGKRITDDEAAKLERNPNVINFGNLGSALAPEGATPCKKAGTCTAGGNTIGDDCCDEGFAATTNNGGCTCSKQSESGSSSLGAASEGATPCKKAGTCTAGGSRIDDNCCDEGFAATMNHVNGVCTCSKQSESGSSSLGAAPEGATPCKKAGTCTAGGNTIGDNCCDEGFAATTNNGVCTCSKQSESESSSLDAAGRAFNLDGSVNKSTRTNEVALAGGICAVVAGLSVVVVAVVMVRKQHAAPLVVAVAGGSENSML